MFCCSLSENICQGKLGWDIVEISNFTIGQPAFANAEIIYNKIYDCIIHSE